MIDRRLFLGAGGASLALAALAPKMAFARAATARRFVFIIQRGAADGLSTIAPTGDPDFAPSRGVLADETIGGHRVDSLFTLHPALAETAKLFAAREALFVHAVASPYRERSHFDGQNVLETGGSEAYRVRDGWMNRLLGLLPQADANALALSPTVPMILRGNHQVSSYAPLNLRAASEDFLMRVSALYESDPQLHSLWTQAMRTRAAAGDAAAASGQDGADAGALAAKLLAGSSGARVAVIESGGWDTHASQRGRLSTQLRRLDRLIGALKAGLGHSWAETLVIAATEFGRTVRPNGTGGTDHGTASAAMLLGGAVEGGKILADWPGLGQAALHEGRDLRPTMDLDALIAGAVSQHFGLDRLTTMKTLFPESRGTPLPQKLVRA